MGKFSVFKGRDGQFYWNLKAGNGEKLCQSEAYQSKQGAQQGILSCRSNAPTAPIEDLT